MISAQRTTRIMATIKQLTLSSILLLGQAFAQAQITDDTYFYGQSEPVYPTPEGSGLGDWASAYGKAKAFVSQLTIEEKTNLTGGTTARNGCSGNINPIQRLSFPGLCVTDAGNGVRGTDFVTGFASGIHAGASWNKQVVYQRGVDQGGEFRLKGVNLQLGPMMGPLGRVAEGGRNWEGFSNDPYLAGKLTAEHIKGVHTQGVGTCAKHFIFNEQELYRNPTIIASNKSVASSSSNIDDTTTHELYMWPFVDAIHAGAVSVMCAYQRANNSYSCQNSKLLNGLLKSELGFQGYVVSDWGAQHSGVGSAEAGMDMVMPSGQVYWGKNLTQAVQNGSVQESRLNDMATRIMATWYYMGQDQGFPQPGIGMPANLLGPHTIVDARNLSSRANVLQTAIEGHVLVKNINNALPLKSPKLLGVFGYDAKTPTVNSPSAGLSGWALGFLSSNVQSVLCGFSPIFKNCPPFEPIASNGTYVTGGGSGATTPGYISAPLAAIQQRALEDGTIVYWDTENVNATAGIDGATDACLVFINAQSSEGVDRPSLYDSFSDNLVNNIADNCANTLVTIHNAGIRLVDGFIDHPNVTAVIYAHLPGQDSGRSLVSVLYGDVSPSGKLPYTVAKNESDYGILQSQYVEQSSQYALFPQDNFTEGVFIDYRAFDAQNITPRYEFGFGLTYSNFTYSDISITKTGAVSEYPTGQIIPGGQADLFDQVLSVTATIANSGTVDAAEIAQLYLTIPAQGQPVRQLRGFDKIMLKGGQSGQVKFSLQRRDISVWDVIAQKWRVPVGNSFGVAVGASSRDLRLNGQISL